MRSAMLMDDTALARYLVLKPETAKSYQTEIHTGTYTHVRQGPMLAHASVAEAGTPEASNPASHLCFCHGGRTRHDEG